MISLDDLLTVVSLVAAVVAPIIGLSTVYLHILISRKSLEIENKFTADLYALEKRVQRLETLLLNGSKGRI